MFFIEISEYIVNSYIYIYIYIYLTLSVRLGVGVGVIFRIPKEEVRRERAGGFEYEHAVKFQGVNRELKMDTADMLYIIGESFRRLKRHDEEEEPERLLKHARSCGYLSFRCDPKTKRLVRCDEEWWMQGREHELPEESHRHPARWWENRYKWVNEQGEPREPDFKSCGKSVRGFEYMKDEFPENQSGEQVFLHCMTGKRAVTLHDIDLTKDDEPMTFGDLCEPPQIVSDGLRVQPAHFLKTQFEHRMAAKMRILSEAPSAKVKKRESNKLATLALRKKMRNRLRTKKRKADMSLFMSEARLRKGEGYSVDQMLRSHVPEIGREIKVSEQEVTAALITKACMEPKSNRFQPNPEAPPPHEAFLRVFIFTINPRSLLTRVEASWGVYHTGHFLLKKYQVLQKKKLKKWLRHLAENWLDFG